MISRHHHRSRVARLIERFPVTAIIEARQVGKTTLARQIVETLAPPTRWYDLESFHDLRRLEDDPELELAEPVAV